MTPPALRVKLKFPSEPCITPLHDSSVPLLDLLTNFPSIICDVLPSTPLCMLFLWSGHPSPLFHLAKSAQAPPPPESLPGCCILYLPVRMRSPPLTHIALCVQGHSLIILYCVCFLVKGRDLVYLLIPVTLPVTNMGPGRYFSMDCSRIRACPLCHRCGQPQRWV